MYSYFRSEIAEREAPEVAGAAICDSDSTPYANEAFIKLFLYTTGTPCVLKYTSWGEFLIIPNNLLSSLDKFRQNYDGISQLYFRNTPMLYYIKHTSPVVYQRVAEDIIKLDAQTSRQYDDWCQSIRQDIYEEY